MNPRVEKPEEEEAEDNLDIDFSDLIFVDVSLDTDGANCENERRQTFRAVPEPDECQQDASQDRWQQSYAALLQRGFTVTKKTTTSTPELDCKTGPRVSPG